MIIDKIVWTEVLESLFAYFSLLRHYLPQGKEEYVRRTMAGRSANKKPNDNCPGPNWSVLSKLGATDNGVAIAIMVQKAAVVRFELIGNSDTSPASLNS